MRNRTLPALLAWLTLSMLPALDAAYAGAGASSATAGPPVGAKAGARSGGAGDSGYVMADFEGSNPLRTPLEGYWYFFDDRFYPSYPNDNIPGNSAVTTFDVSGQPLRDSAGGFDTASFPVGRGGETGSRSLRFGYALGTRRLSCGGSCTFDPFVAFGIIFASQPDTLDLSSASGITFWARSDSDSVRVQVGVGTRDSLAEAPDYVLTLTIGPAWSRFSIPLRASDGLRQPERGPRKPFVPSRAYGLLFTIEAGPNSGSPVNALRIDDLVIGDWSFPPPVPDALRRPGPRAPDCAPASAGLRGTPAFGVRNGTDFRFFDSRGRVRPRR